MAVVAPRPDSSLFYRSWPYGTGLSALLVVAGTMVGEVVARQFGADRTDLDLVNSTALALFVCAVLANLQRLAVGMHRSSREFANRADADIAIAMYRRLVRVGVGFIADEAWDNLSRASRGGYPVTFADMHRALYRIATNAHERAPEVIEASDFVQRLRDLDSKLREDPK